MKRNLTSVAFSAVVLTVVGFLAFHLHRSAKQEALARFEEYYVFATRHLANQLQSYLQDRTRGLKVLASFGSLQYHDQDRIADDISEFFNFLKREYVVAVSVYDEKGTIVYSTDQRAIGSSDAKCEFFEWARKKENKGKVLVSTRTGTQGEQPGAPPAAGMPDSSGDYNLSHFHPLLVAPLYQDNVDGRYPRSSKGFAGAVSLAIDLEKLLVAELAFFMPKMKSPPGVFLVANDGTLLVQSEHQEMVGKNIHGRDRRCSQCHTSFDYIEKMLAEKQGTVEYRLKQRPTKLAAFASVHFEDVSWILGVEAAYHEVTAFATRNLRQTLLLLSAVVLALAGGSAFMYRDYRSKVKAEEEAKHWREKHALEDRIRESESRLRSITESAPDAIIAADSRGIILSWNKGAQSIFGYEEAEALGTPLTLLMPARYENAHSSALEPMRSGGEGKIIGKTVESHGLRKDGTEFPVEISLGTWKTVQGTFYSGIIRDVTERKRAEETLREAKDAAEAGSRAKSEFLANISHELRTPMNGIIGMTDLLLDTELTPEQQEYLAMVKESADALLALMNQILDFCDIEVQEIVLDSIAFNLRESLDSTMEPLSLQAQKKGLKLACHVFPEVPDGLVGDPQRLRQVVANLVGNAIKFSERGEVVVEVKREEDSGEREAKSVKRRAPTVLHASRSTLHALRSTVHAPRSTLHALRSTPYAPRCTLIELHFSVRDSGIGIPRDKIQSIFDPFSQVDGSATRKYGGSGLGLTISSRLVEMMGGRIWAESEVGTGSTFHFTARFGLAST